MSPIALLVLALAADSPPTGPVPPVRPSADLSALFGPRDYPLEAIRRAEHGDVGFRLVVGPNGRVTRCDILASSGSRALDEVTCRILRERARFRPARDSLGRPVADVVVSRVHWEMPQAAALATYIASGDYPMEALRRRQQGRVEFELIIGADGRPADCRILTSSGSAALDEATCRIMRERPRFAPARDPAGQPTTDVVRSAVRWVLPGRPPIPAPRRRH